MIGCDTCSTWQHLVCFGYENQNDKRIPSTFICYNCENKGKQLTPSDIQEAKGFISLILFII